MTMARTNDVAVVGLGVMGANLARNFARRGHRVAVYDRSRDRADALAGAHPDAQLAVAATFEELVAKLERPRQIVLLVPAGTPVDDVLDALDPLLERGDILVDAGNSHYADTDRRFGRASTRPWGFVGMGVSGGAHGALEGPSIMPGGDREAWERLRPVLESIAAKSELGACVAYCGGASAGHFVKIVHNGIEYGDMQLIAETALLLREGLGLSAANVADVFSEWNRGELESFLIEITADVFRTHDPRDPSRLLLDAILDRAGQKGTGRWTVHAALDLGVPIPTIAAAVDARSASGDKDLRVRAAARFASARARIDGATVDDLRAALYASKIASYTQGFALLSAASTARGYGTDLAEVARIWTAGCIIRARFLGDVARAFRGDGAELLVLAPSFATAIDERLGALRRVVSAATKNGYAVPGLAASLTWFDTLTTARGSASLIQAQRDYFGSHTYERVDAPGVAVHTAWPRGGGCIER
jgi:6-phosphogluconate dehydrogenase